jgi:DNA-binding CsgD family transcriptional regulator
MAHPLLTDRQAEVLQLVCDGQHSQREVADALGLSPATLAHYLGTIRRRLDRTSIDELCRELDEDRPTLAPTR